MHTYIYIELELLHARARAPHRLHVRLAAGLVDVPHQRDLLRRLEDMFIIMIIISSSSSNVIIIMLIIVCCVLIVLSSLLVVLPLL